MPRRIRGPSAGVRPRDLGIALLASIAVVLSAPFMGELQLSLRRALGPSFGAAVNLSIAAVVLGAGIGAARRIRDRRLVRWSAIAGAVVAGAIYVRAAALPAIERIHFAEYGVLAFLFYRAFDRSLVPAALATVIASVADEWLQWFVPGRYGELRDLALNSAAMACGLLFSAGVDPPAPRDRRPARSPGSALSMTAGVAVLVLAAFVHSVHLGYAIEDAEVGSFDSRYSASDLTRRSTRTAPRSSAPASSSSALSREDQYLTEGLWHVQERNTKWNGGDLDAAWRENRILEKYFVPVLAAGHAWPAEQRADGARRQQPGRIYVSRAERYPILTWAKRWFWLATLVVLGAVTLAPRAFRGAAAR